MNPADRKEETAEAETQAVDDDDLRFFNLWDEEFERDHISDTRRFDF